MLLWIVIHEALLFTLLGAPQGPALVDVVILAPYRASAKKIPFCLVLAGGEQNSITLATCILYNI